MIFWVGLKFQCIFELGFELLTQYNDNLIDKYIVGWILVMSEKKDIYTVEELKFVRVI